METVVTIIRSEMVDEVVVVAEVLVEMFVVVVLTETGSTWVFRNVHGWNKDCEPINSILRSSCILNYDFDIVGIAETHLRRDETISRPGNNWIGYIRLNLHINANTGSGGIGFFSKNDLYLDFTITVLDKSSKGILWLKFVHKRESVVFMSCVCYLPPENSSRTFDVNSFYEILTTDIYKFQTDGLLFVCGDFNSRCGALEDFLCGVDEILHCDVIDFKFHKYGELLIESLTSTNMCMLNGRNYITNGFTSVSTKGLSVVSYCFTTRDNICKLSAFSVKNR